MAFTCEVSFSEVNLGSALPVGDSTFGQYLAQPGEFIGPGSGFLFFNSADRLFEVRSRFPALVRDLPRQSGDTLEEGAVLAVLLAEGEDVPPGFRYCTLHELREK